MGGLTVLVLLSLVALGYSTTYIQEGTTMTTKVNNAKLDTRTVTSKDTIADGLADIIKYIIIDQDQNETDDIGFQIVGGSPKLEFKTMLHEGAYCIIQAFGKWSAINTTSYNPDDKTYSTSVFFEGLNAGNVGLVKYDAELKTTGLDDYSKGFRKAFGDKTGYELVKVSSTKPKATKGTTTSAHWG